MILANSFKAVVGLLIAFLACTVQLHADDPKMRPDFDVYIFEEEEIEDMLLVELQAWDNIRLLYVIKIRMVFDLKTGIIESLEVPYHFSYSLSPYVVLVDEDLFPLVEYLVTFTKQDIKRIKAKTVRDRRNLSKN